MKKVVTVILRTETYISCYRWQIESNKQKERQTDRQRVIERRTSSSQWWCFYVHQHTLTDRQTDRQTYVVISVMVLLCPSTHTDRQTDKQTDRQTYVRGHLSDGASMSINTDCFVGVKVVLSADGTCSSWSHHEHKVTPVTRAHGTTRRQLDIHWPMVTIHWPLVRPLVTRSSITAQDEQSLSTTATQLFISVHTKYTHPQSRHLVNTNVDKTTFMPAIASGRYSKVSKQCIAV